jgi:hypothetical protein
MRTILLIVLFTLLSRVGRVWQGGQFHGSEALKSAAAFQAGVAMYWLSLHHLETHGFVAVLIGIGWLLYRTAR